MKWTKLSCRRFKDNAARLQLFALAYNLANSLRQLALPRSIRSWNLTTLREKLVKMQDILACLNNDKQNLATESSSQASTIEALKYTPAAALGTCRYKIDFKKKPDRAAKEMDRLFQSTQQGNGQ